jgi:hypothetical protein
MSASGVLVDIRIYVIVNANTNYRGARIYRTLAAAAAAGRVEDEIEEFVALDGAVRFQLNRVWEVEPGGRLTELAF